MKAAYEGKQSSFEAVHPTADGGHINVIFNATPIKLDRGVYLSVTGIDITQRRLLENKLNMLFAAIEQGPTSVVITDLDANLEYVNPRFSEVTGYAQGEVIGKNPRVLQSGLTKKSVYVDMWEKLTHGKRWIGELVNKRKNGETYYEEAYISPVKNSEGQVSHYVAVKLDITERKKLESQIRQLAFYDALTGLPNRRLLVDRMSQVMTAGKRSKQHGALMFLDLDNFKPLNDTHGHAMGDLLLIEAARRLESCVREMDTVARFGGDEFVVMLTALDKSKVNAEAQAHAIAEKIRYALSLPYLLKTLNQDGAEVTVEHLCTVSVGVVVFVDHQATQDDLMIWADKAMYEAKDGGRNCIKFYGVNDVPLKQ